MTNEQKRQEIARLRKGAKAASGRLGKAIQARREYFARAANVRAPGAK